MFISAEVLSYYYFRKKLFTKYIQHEILLDPKDGSRADGMGGIGKLVGGADKSAREVKTYVNIEIIGGSSRICVG